MYIRRFAPADADAVVRVSELATRITSGAVYDAAFVEEMVAQQDRAEASSLYILSYYLGSSFIGWVSGYFFAHGWGLFIGWLMLLTLIALVTAFAAMQRDKALS